MVISKDGFITRGNSPNIYDWTSAEDQAFYFKKLQQYPLLFMGSTTYNVVAKQLNQTAKRMRVVFTRRPRHYNAHQNSQTATKNIVFTSQTPLAAVAHYQNLGHKTAALVGGGKLYSSFLQAGLISEMYVTVEPVIFGSGTPLFTYTNLGQLKDYQLMSKTALNANGTVLLHYVQNPE